jgi:hypothetical protein
MLSKLLKHEFKATARLLLPLYLILIVLTLFGKLVQYFDIFKGVLNIIPATITFAYVISIIATVALTFIITIQRFYKNLMTDEGYLMFTLPVKAPALINSKLIVSLIWSVINIGAVVISIIIIISGTVPFNDIISSIKEIFTTVTSQFGSLSFLLVTEFIIMIIVGIVFTIMLIYLSLAIGQLFNAHKIIASITAYIGINFIIQVVTSFGAVFIGYLFNDVMYSINSVPKLIFPVFILYYLMLTVIFYIATNIIFNRKLNLE